MQDYPRDNVETAQPLRHTHLVVTGDAAKAMEPPLGARVAVDRGEKLPVEGVVIARFATHLRNEPPRIGVMVPELPCDWESESHVFRPRVGDVTLQAIPERAVEPEMGWAPASRPNARDEHVPGTRAILAGPQHVDDIARGLVPPAQAAMDTWIINEPWAEQKVTRERLGEQSETTRIMASPQRRGASRSIEAKPKPAPSTLAPTHQPGLNF